jgi:hypothetical protein
MRVMVKMVVMAVGEHCLMYTLRNLPKPVNRRGSKKCDVVYSQDE